MRVLLLGRCLLCCCRLLRCWYHQEVYQPREYELSKHMIEKPPMDTSRMVLSPMPGKLISLMVKEGDEVRVGASFSPPPPKKRPRSRALAPLAFNASPHPAGRCMCVYVWLCVCVHVCVVVRNCALLFMPVGKLEIVLSGVAMNPPVCIYFCARRSRRARRCASWRP